MCNDFGNQVPHLDYLAAFSQPRIPVKWPNAIPNLQPRDDIWPTDRAPIHDRQKVVLRRSNWVGMAAQTGNEKELLRALPAGSPEVEQVR